MPKPTLMQRAFGIPTQTYADSIDSPLFADPNAPYSQSFALSQSSGMSRAPSIRSVASSRAPSESGRSRRSVTFDDGASDTGRSIRSYTSSIRSFNTTASKRSALGLTPPKDRKSSGAMDIGPSLRSGQQSGLLLSGGSMRMPKVGHQKTSRRYATAENLAALQARTTPTELTLPPPPKSKAEEAYAASQRRMAGLASIGAQPPSPVRSVSGHRASDSSDTIRAPDSPSRANGIKRSQSLSAPTPRKKKTAEEIVAAMEKAGILDRVMEVLPEEDEGHTPSPEQERPAWLDQTPRRPLKDSITASAPEPQLAQAYVTQPVFSQSAPQTAEQPAPPASSTASHTPTTQSPRTGLLSDFATYPMRTSPSPAPILTAEEQPAIDAAPTVQAVVAPVLPSEPKVSAAKAATLDDAVANMTSVEAVAPKATIPEAVSVAQPTFVPAGKHERQMSWTAPALSTSPFANSPSGSPPLQHSPPKPRPPAIPLVDSGRVARTEGCPLVLTKLVFERIQGSVLLTGQMHGLRPPLYALVRYTMNSWNSYTDVEVETSSEQDFSVYLLTPMLVGRFELAVRMRDVTGREIWDSNEGRNYTGSYDATSPVASRVVSPAISPAAPATPAVAKAHSPGPLPLPPPVTQAQARPAPSDQTLQTMHQEPVVPRLQLSPSPPASTSESDELSPAPSSNITTPSESLDGLQHSLIRPIPVKAPVVTSAALNGSAAGAMVPPRMTLTRTESAQNATVDMPMPVTPPAPQQRRVSFTPDAKEDESERSPAPIVPVRSPKRTAAPNSTPAVASWAPNAKSLSGPEGTVSLGKPKATKPAAAVTPRTLSESLPKARSLPQASAADPAALLAESLPKAPPRASLAEASADTVIPPARPVSPLSEPSVYSRASATRIIPAPSGTLQRDVSPELLLETRDQRSESISGQSFSNEPFVAKRSKLADLDASLEGPYGSRNNTSTPSQTSLVGVIAEQAPRASESPELALSDRVPSRRYAFTDNGPPLRSTMSAMELPRSIPKAPRSIFSDSVSVSGRSDVARSVMSVPSGAYRPSRNVGKVGYLSETLDGSSPTMCAIAIMSNAATSLSRSRFSVFSSSTSKGRSSSALPPHLNGKWGGGQAKAHFTEAASAPKKMGSSEVLVQIYAVGVDLWDRARVSTLVERGDGYGYIPGRSFCGKAVEVGVDVTRVRKGDFVYGLQDLRKSGALADLCVVNRDYVALAPQGTLSVEAIASLPCCGVPAFQAMETLCHDLPRGSKVLILEAHIGVGAIALQLSQCLRSGRDLWITCQCPLRASEAELFCRANGASETLRDDPLVILNSLHESSYDAVVDTVGGRRIYDAARRVLHHEGLFVTVVGDELTPPTTKAHWRAGIRSLRRAFVKKDKKSIGYLCPGLDEREDCRESLDRLTSLAEANLLQPVVKRVLPFEQGGLAFAELLADDEDGTVIRVLET